MLWAVDCLDVGASDHLLEIGCGHGVAVSLICPKLDGGTILAIDRSPKMIAAATARNARHVADGKAAFIQASSDALPPFERTFEKAFAIHVPVFLRGDPTRDVAEIRSCLSANGLLYVMVQPLPAVSIREVANGLRRTLGDSGLSVVDVRIDQLDQGPAVCVVATTPSH